MEKDALYRWLAGNGYTRVSAVAPDGTITHEWERYCSDCAMLSYLSTDPNNYSEAALDAIFESAKSTVAKCGHPVSDSTIQ